MRESLIEAYLRRLSVKNNALCLKWTGSPGMPDRIVIRPSNNIVFVELKSTNGKLRPLQIRAHDILKDFGCKVLVINDIDQVDEFLKG